nr:MAG TPA: hypothetical protein [Caudoviricetes sp.]
MGWEPEVVNFHFTSAHEKTTNTSMIFRVIHTESVL